MKLINRIHSAIYKSEVIYSDKQNWICTPNGQKTILEVRDAKTKDIISSIPLTKPALWTNIILLEDEQKIIYSYHNGVCFVDINTKVCDNRNLNYNILTIEYIDKHILLNISNIDMSISNMSKYSIPLNKYIDKTLQYADLQQYKFHDFHAPSWTDYKTKPILNLWNGIHIYSINSFIFAFNIKTSKPIKILNNKMDKTISVYIEDKYLYCVSLRNIFYKYEITLKGNNIELVLIDTRTHRINSTLGGLHKDKFGYLCSVDGNLNISGLKYNQVISNLNKRDRLVYGDSRVGDIEIYWTEGTNIYYINRDSPLN